MKHRQILINLRLSGRNKTHHIAIPGIVVFALSFLKKAALLGLVLFTLQIGSLLYQQITKHILIKEKISIIKKTEELNNELDSYISSIATLTQEDNNLRMKYSFKPIENELRMLGVGGPINHDSTLLTISYPSLRLNKTVSSKINYLNRQTEMNVTNFEELRKHLEHRVDSWRYIPSILPSYGRIASQFGMRTHPVTGEYKLHEGLDIANKPWTPIVASADGVIKRARVGKFFGNYVVIDHGNGYETVYGHMNKYDVKEGQFISRGNVIGYMGKTGRTTGTHLHYEVHKNNRPYDPIDYVLPTNYSID